MKTMQEHYEERMNYYFQGFSLGTKAKSEPTGVACPECNSELYDPTPHITLLSWPPSRNVACACGYRGTMLR